jgi:hypothetical protein
MRLSRRRHPGRSWASRCADGGERDRDCCLAERRESERGGADSCANESSLGIARWEEGGGGEGEAAARATTLAAPSTARRRHPRTPTHKKTQVLDVGQVVAGNFCGALLAYFGADVIKVEPPGAGDALRSLRELDAGGTSLWWRAHGRNRRCITAGALWRFCLRWVRQRAFHARSLNTHKPTTIKTCAKRRGATSCGGSPSAPTCWSKTSGQVGWGFVCVRVCVFFGGQSWPPPAPVCKHHQTHTNTKHDPPQKIGTLEQWALGPDDLAAANPGLVFVRISGYGQTGPLASHAGYASACEAYGGLRSINGYADRPPVRPNLSLGDTLAGLHGAFGAVMALLARTRAAADAAAAASTQQGGGSGDAAAAAAVRGQVVDASISESVFNMLEACVVEAAEAGVERACSGSTISGRCAVCCVCCVLCVLRSARLALVRLWSRRVGRLFNTPPPSALHTPHNKNNKASCRRARGAAPTAATSSSAATATACTAA